jgi:hypothetical protein
MRLEKASAKAVKYAIMNFHYSKAVPMVQAAYAVFNDNNEFCGVICYSLGANNQIGSPYGLKQGQVVELVRVALNGKQINVSKPVSISLRLLKKDCPNVKLIVSYADPIQEHVGCIYQATNWYYEGQMPTQHNYFVKGKWVHGKTANNALGTIKGVPSKKVPGKLKYIYPLDKALVPMCKALHKPYPKKEIQATA